MRTIPSLQLLCQLGAFALGVGAQSGIVEVDLIIPQPNVVYELDAKGRVPLVWAVRNGHLFNNGEVIIYYNLYESKDATNTITHGNLNLGTITTSDTQYLSVPVGMKPEQAYFLNWVVEGEECNTYQRFSNHSGGPLKDIPKAEIGWNINFYTKPGGQKSDVLSAMGSNCTSRAAVAFNIAEVTKTSCRQLDDDDPFPFPQPCDLQIGDAAAVAANISKDLDDQFNRTCSSSAYPPSDCPPSQKKSAATQIGTAAMLLGLPALALLL